MWAGNSLWRLPSSASLFHTWGNWDPQGSQLASVHPEVRDQSWLPDQDASTVPGSAGWVPVGSRTRGSPEAGRMRGYGVSGNVGAYGWQLGASTMVFRFSALGALQLPRALASQSPASFLWTTHCPASQFPAESLHLWWPAHTHLLRPSPRYFPNVSVTTLAACLLLVLGPANVSQRIWETACRSPLTLTRSLLQWHKWKLSVPDLSLQQLQEQEEPTFILGQQVPRGGRKSAMPGPEGVMVQCHEPGQGASGPWLTWMSENWGERVRGQWLGDRRARRPQGRHPCGHLSHTPLHHGHGALQHLLPTD